MARSLMTRKPTTKAKLKSSAARVGKPVGTVKSWVRRGLLSLKDCLS